MRGIVAILIVLALAHASYSKVFPDNCSLAKALYAQGLPKNLLPDWVCLVNAESGRNTRAKGGPNSDGSYDFGLFQINSRYWCKIGSVGGDCSANCNSFIDDNITDDTKCAKLIYKRHGFNAWYGWKAKCQGSKPNLSGCGI